MCVQPSALPVAGCPPTPLPGPSTLVALRRCVHRTALTFHATFLVWARSQSSGAFGHAHLAYTWQWCALPITAGKHPVPGTDICTIDVSRIAALAATRLPSARWRLLRKVHASRPPAHALTCARTLAAARSCA
jgi:hypothetical protein